MEEEEDGQGKQELAELAIQYGFKKKVTPTLSFIMHPGSSNDPSHKNSNPYKLITYSRVEIFPHTESIALPTVEVLSR
jgi:radical SAM superfamily enzyme YgiQ (UPF0313 family)